MKKIVYFFKILYIIKNIGTKKALERLESFLYDPLTGLLNRRSLDRERKDDYGVIFIDLDNFGELNKAEGHDKGDKILQVFSRILKSHSRREDLFMRYGGDEFVLILPGTKSNDAKELVKRIERETAEASDELFSLTFSWGVSEGKGEKDVKKIITIADKEMQKNKKKKKGVD